MGVSIAQMGVPPSPPRPRLQRKTCSMTYVHSILCKYYKINCKSNDDCQLFMKVLANHSLHRNTLSNLLGLSSKEILGYHYHHSLLFGPRMQASLSLFPRIRSWVIESPISASLSTISLHSTELLDILRFWENLVDAILTFQVWDSVCRQRNTEQQNCHMTDTKRFPPGIGPSLNQRILAII